ncbi:hypothetical protein DPMN_085675 [Dreissena polymorpha]|uniref:Uncharacterized protein n=1 Tax=Dreissena polymorpha TaxID=45954 RepID=A0A9D3YG68_DREPO|nr:hypothetical protein DPMN_085675 [Dreissena polymorpha]
MVLGMETGDRSLPELVLNGDKDDNVNILYKKFQLRSGLILAVLQNEHFRLKMLYKEKKMTSAQRERLEETEKRWDNDHDCTEPIYPKSRSSARSTRNSHSEDIIAAGKPDAAEQGV